MEFHVVICMIRGIPLILSQYTTCLHKIEHLLEELNKFEEVKQIHRHSSARTKQIQHLPRIINIHKTVFELEIILLYDNGGEGPQYFKNYLVGNQAELIMQFGE